MLQYHHYQFQVVSYIHFYQYNIVLILHHIKINIYNHYYLQVNRYLTKKGWQRGVIQTKKIPHKHIQKEYNTLDSNKYKKHSTQRLEHMQAKVQQKFRQKHSCKRSMKCKECSRVAIYYSNCLGVTASVGSPTTIGH